MEKLFKKLVLLAELGELSKANYYNEEFATMDFKKDGKIYTISIRCEDTKDGNF